MPQTRTNRSKVAMTVAVALSGGTLFSACQARIKDALVGGFTDFILGPTTAATVVEAILGPDDAPSDETQDE